LLVKNAIAKNDTEPSEQRQAAAPAQGAGRIKACLDQSESRAGVASRKGAAACVRHNHVIEGGFDGNPRGHAPECGLVVRDGDGEVLGPFFAVDHDARRVHTLSE
jgi:hypothetical protein